MKAGGSIPQIIADYEVPELEPKLRELVRLDSSNTKARNLARRTHLRTVYGARSKMGVLRCLHGHPLRVHGPTDMAGLLAFAFRRYCVAMMNADEYDPVFFGPKRPGEWRELELEPDPPQDLPSAGASSGYVMGELYRCLAAYVDFSPGTGCLPDDFGANSYSTFLRLCDRVSRMRAGLPVTGECALPDAMTKPEVAAAALACLKGFGLDPFALPNASAAAESSTNRQTTSVTEGRSHEASGAPKLQAWKPPFGYVSIKDIMHDNRFQKNGHSPSRTTVQAWETRANRSPGRRDPVKVVHSPQYREAYYPEEWVMQQIARWTPRSPKPAT